ncbi:radial spoke head protein 9 homolog [Triplophysa rosa]|uniref:Radial spoke head protein 9 homolog n=1 Tax=Triplophysa rosa TaxID=992332 RepID=A0A9W7T9Q9_TRIRA|nr:radial spoke head protein 9 homolog [Triplophysa rosa]KAI7792172.1 radial spoke head protein 9-like protein [Triplophysa rosa]
MDSDSLHYFVDLAAGDGLTLSGEQRASLQTSLVILQKNYKFSRVLFWGKILGIKCDYFIAQGIEEDEMKNKKTLYSLNCLDWHLLPPATDSMIADVEFAAEGRFTGDPSHEYQHTEMRTQGEGDETKEEEVTVKVNEESRLAVTVFNIDKDASVVPRGAFIKSPGGKVKTNLSFKGLHPTEAAKLRNYLHFREPVNLKMKSILEMADLNPAVDFLDPLSEDIPKGSWSLQFERGGTVCALRSLLWLGLTFFHIPQTPQHGYIYMGDGLLNLDLPFML